MSDFTELNWKSALANLYSRAAVDPVFRTLCLTKPLEAIQQVSDIKVPAGIKLQFFDKREDYLYAYLLPPAVDIQSSGETPLQDLMRWNTLCTDITTTLTGAE